MKNLFHALAFTLGMFGISSHATAQNTTAGNLPSGNCPFTVPGLTIQCGTVDVPADHANPNGQAKVQLFYARVPAQTPVPDATPVAILAGGPGSGASQLLQLATAIYAGIHQNQDLIFIDQRGTGYSLPSLRCPNLPPQSVLYGQLNRKEVRDCLRPLTRAGYKTAWFDTHQSALDLIALRKHLAISRWNLLATSYGTVLAQELMRLDSAGIRSVVLNSPTKANASQLDTDTVMAIPAAWNQIFLDCAAAPDCAAQAPALRAHALEVLARVAKNPLPATWSTPSGQPQAGLVSQADLQTALNGLGGNGKGSVWGISAYVYYYRVLSGTLPNNPAITGAMYMPASAWQSPQSAALGLNLSITCREVMPYLKDIRQLRRKATAAQPFVAPSLLMKPYQRACPIWQAGRAAPQLNAPVSTNVPVLILTGNYDMLAPSYLAQEIAGHLPNVRLASFNGVGHAVFESDTCAQQLVSTFLNQADTKVSLPCLLPSPASGITLYNFS